MGKIGEMGEMGSIDRAVRSRSERALDTIRHKQPKHLVSYTEDTTRLRGISERVRVNIIRWMERHPEVANPHDNTEVHAIINGEGGVPYSGTSMEYDGRVYKVYHWGFRDGTVIRYNHGSEDPDTRLDWSSFRC